MTAFLFSIDKYQNFQQPIQDDPEGSRYLI